MAGSHEEIIARFRAIHVMSDIELEEAINAIHELAEQAKERGWLSITQFCWEVSAGLAAEMERRPGMSFDVPGEGWVKSPGL